jgi:putative sterol carrier protein
MPEIDPQDFSRLTAAVKSMSGDELIATIQRQEGGIDAFLDRIFAGMRDSFRPEKAGGVRATLQYDLATPDGTRTWGMRVADGHCEVSPGPVDNPQAGLRSGLADFLGLITGRLNPMTALMTGKVKVTGDLFLLRQAEQWFERPDVG